MQITADYMGFEADLKKFAQLLDVEVRLVVRRIAFDLFRRIVRRTPVDTGRARASWIMTQGSPSTEVLPEGSYSQQGKAQPNIDGYAPIWISNNLDYIETLEFGLYPGEGPKTSGGFSIQAPQGMVRLSLAEIETQLAAEVQARI